MLVVDDVAVVVLGREADVEQLAVVVHVGVVAKNKGSCEIV